MIDFIKQWIDYNNINVEWTSNRSFKLDSKDHICIEAKKGKLFDENFNIIIDEDELNSPAAILIDYWCFAFGGKVYRSSCKEEKITLNLLKYIGQAREQSGFSYLGIHGGYELCIGSRNYTDWCQKAKWLGIKTVGIAEKHTLAGTLKFQQAAKKAELKSIIGATYTIRYNTNEYKVKLYVKNDIGWANLLRIHKQLNVDNNGANITEEHLLNHSEGLYCVFSNDTMLTPDLIERYLESKLERYYFQFDPVEYKAEQRDLYCLNCLKIVLQDYGGIIDLVLIPDSYYLDKEDHSVKKILNFIGKVGFEYQSEDQYFKSLEDIAMQTITLFNMKGEDRALEILQSALENVNEIADNCNFQIKTGEIHLPKYEMTNEEKEQFASNEDLFWSAINEGLERKIINKGKDVNVYLERLEKETKVILESGLEDYFLMLYDLIKWCQVNNILTGIGRGSAAGSLISYCLSITEVDPIEYDLLFERFVNQGRLPKVIVENGVKKLVGGSMADIDIDVISVRRDDVKRYLESRYGANNVCSIGTYNALLTKAAFRDVLRFDNEEPQNINYFGGMIEDSEETITSLFLESAKNNKLKEFINEHSNVVSKIDLILGQPKTSSIHASGIVITPTIENTMEIYDWFPCKKMDEVLVSEWEGSQLDESGFLKADILGLSQLDKFADILTLIKNNTGEEIDLNEIDLTDKEVYRLFQKGMNQDVFQFSGDGLSGYCREIKPENIEDLTMVNAIYRPGPMGSGAHNETVKIKFGKQELKYDFGTEEITKNTYGFSIFQEQVMQVCVSVGGFSLLEADDIRKAMGKKLEEKIKPYRERFVSGAVAKGCPEYEAINLWNKLELFAGYGFNRSHSVSYAITGYRCQWLKVHYPLEFWTISLQHADDDDVAKRVSELRKFDQIKLYPPDINKSKSSFYTDFETNSIYWSIGRIKHVGEVALNYIANERKERGDFFSLEEFIKRCKSQAVNSRVVKHLIYSGCFDNLHAIQHPLQRKKLMEQFYELYRLDSDLPEDHYKEFYWYKMQRNLSGFGYFDYSTIVDELGFDYQQHITSDQVQMKENEGCDVVIGGILQEFVRRKTKKGEMCKLTIDHNNDLVDVVLWNSEWIRFQKEIEEKGEGVGIMVNGQIKFDSFNKKNVIYSSEKTRVELF